MESWKGARCTVTTTTTSTAIRCADGIAPIVAIDDIEDIDDIVAMDTIEGIYKIRVLSFLKGGGVEERTKNQKKSKKIKKIKKDVPFCKKSRNQNNRGGMQNAEC